jgi:hypothetical protein
MSIHRRVGKRESELIWQRKKELLQYEMFLKLAYC